MNHHPVLRRILYALLFVAAVVLVVWTSVYGHGQAVTGSPKPPSTSWTCRDAKDVQAWPYRLDGM